MKQYIETKPEIKKDGKVLSFAIYKIGEKYIPGDSNTKSYQDMLIDVNAGDAEIIHYTEPEIIKTPRQKAFELMDAQTVEVQAEFATVWGAVNNMLDLGKTDVAIQLIQNTTVSAELESIKQQILSTLQGA